MLRQVVQIIAPVIVISFSQDARGPIQTLTDDFKSMPEDQKDLGLWHSESSMNIEQQNHYTFARKFASVIIPNQRLDDGFGLVDIEGRYLKSEETPTGSNALFSYVDFEQATNSEELEAFFARENKERKGRNVAPRQYSSPKRRRLLGAWGESKETKDRYKQSPPVRGDALWLLKEFLDKTYPGKRTQFLGDDFLFPNVHQPSIWSQLERFCGRPEYQTIPYRDTLARLSQKTERTKQLLANIVILRDVLNNHNKWINTSTIPDAH